MDVKKTIADWRWRIVKAGYTQSSFARELGIAPSSLTDYFSGRIMPSLERFELIENTLADHEFGGGSSGC